MTDRSVPRRKFLKTGSIGITSALIAGCTSDGNGDGSDGSNGSDSGGGSTDGGSGSIKVGLLAPLSGAYAATGREDLNGAQMAIKELNEDGGILGQEVEGLERDTELDTSVATQHIRDLYENENIVGISGPVGSATTLAVNDVATELQLPSMITGSTAKATGEQCSKYSFRHYPNAHMTATSIGSFGVEDGWGMNWALMNNDYAWGESIGATERAINQANGGNIVSEQVVPISADDYSSSLNRVRSEADETDVLFMNLYGSGQITILNQAVNMGLKEDMKLVIPVWNSTLASALDPGTLEDVHGVLKGYWPAEESGWIQDFVSQYQGQFDGIPSAAAWTGYICTKELLLAYDRAGENDPDAAVSELEGRTFDNVSAGEDNWPEWRACDHQSTQDMWVVQGNGDTVLDGTPDFDILTRLGPEKTMRDCSETGCSF